MLACLGQNISAAVTQGPAAAAGALFRRAAQQPEAAALDDSPAQRSAAVVLRQPTAGYKCTTQSRLMSAAGRPSFLWCSFSHDSQHHMQQRGQQQALQGSAAATDRSSDGDPFPNDDPQLRIGTSGNMATSSAAPHHTNIQPAAPQHVLWHKSHLPTTTAANSTPVIDAHQLRLSTPDSRRVPQRAPQQICGRQSPTHMSAANSIP